MKDFSSDPAAVVGATGERMIVRVLQEQGFGIVPSYDYSGKHGEKAPKLMFASRRFALPDLDVCRNGTRFWVEVKSYHGPAYNRALKEMVHGIPRRLFEGYQEVQKESGVPVVIVVIEIDSGEALARKMKGLEVFPCMCSGCRRGGRCAAPIKSGIYWRRSDMQRQCSFSPAEMAEIRSAHAALGAVRPPIGAASPSLDMSRINQ